MFEFLLHVLSITGIYALMALGLNIQAGQAGLLNFGHIAFAGVGAYATGIGSAAGWPAPFAMAAGMLAAALVALFMARLGRQLGADYWAIATLAVAEILRTIAVNEGWLTGGAQGISSIPALFDELSRGWARWAFAALVLASVSLVALLAVRLGRGRFGRALRLMREEPQLATCLGYNLVGLKTRAMVAGAVVTAYAGSLIAHYTSFVGPDYLMASETFLIWTIVIIGGLGNTAGILVGAVAVQAIYVAVPFLRDGLGIGSDLAGALRIGVVGAILLACLLWRVEGLIPEKLRGGVR